MEDPMPCDELQTFQQMLEAKEAEDIYIIAIETLDQITVVSFEDGSSLEIEAECIKAFEIDEADWLVRIEYEGESSVQVLRFVGSINFAVQYNPTGFNPLGAKIGVFAPVPGKVELRVIGKNGPESDAIHRYQEYLPLHEVACLGLYADALNQVEVSFLKWDESIRIKDTLMIQTDPIPVGLPDCEVTIRKSAQMEPGWTLVSHMALFLPQMPFIFDPFGDIRWLLNFDSHPVLTDLLSDVGVERLQNGNYYFGDINSATIYEVDPLGFILNSWPLPSGYGFHHHVLEKPDGNFLLTANKWSSTHLNGASTIEDYVLEIDRTTGGLVHEWDFKELLDEYREALGPWVNNNTIDWLHLNGLNYDATDNTIVVSGRHQGVVKVGYDNQVRWILAPHHNWGQNRMGQELNQFLLSPIMENGATFSTDVQNGFQIDPDFDWPWYQHAPKVLPNGNILVFDNGQFRNFGTPGSYSRAVEYEIDETNKTVRQVWSYGESRGLETFSEIISDVDFLTPSNNILFSPGHDVDNGNGNRGGKIVEVDYLTQEVVYEVNINNPIANTLTMHRTERLNLYPDY